MSENKTINLKDAFSNLKWWQATIMMVSILMAAGFAAYMGANVNVNVDLSARVENLERRIDIPVNSSLSGLTKQCSYLISQVGSYYCMQNGTNGRLDYYSTNLTRVEQYANGNLTSGGLIWLKGLQWASGLTISDNVVVIEEYQGTLRAYSNDGKAWLLPKLAVDPDTTGWTDNEAPFWWYNTGEDTIKYWNGTAKVSIPGIGGGSPPGGTYSLPLKYNVYKTGGAYHVESSTGQDLYSNALPNLAVQYTVDNIGTGGLIKLTGASFSGWDSRITINGKNLAIQGDGIGSTILQVKSTYSDTCVIEIKGDARVTLSDFSLDLNKKNTNGFYGSQVNLSSFSYSAFVNLDVQQVAEGYWCYYFKNPSISEFFDIKGGGDGNGMWWENDYDTHRGNSRCYGYKWYGSMNADNNVALLMTSKLGDMNLNGFYGMDLNNLAKTPPVHTNRTGIWLASRVSGHTTQYNTFYIDNMEHFSKNFYIENSAYNSFYGPKYGSTCAYDPINYLIYVTGTKSSGNIWHDSHTDAGNTTCRLIYEVDTPTNEGNSYYDVIGSGTWCATSDFIHVSANSHVLGMTGRGDHPQEIAEIWGTATASDGDAINYADPRLYDTPTIVLVTVQDDADYYAVGYAVPTSTGFNLKLYDIVHAQAETVDKTISYYAAVHP